jgi:alpha-mannosidase
MFPDPGQDQGAHHLEVGIVVGAEVVDAVAEGYRTNLPVRTVTDAAAESVVPLVAIDESGVVVEAIKLAQDGSGDVVVRLYEALGQRVHARLEAGFDVTGVAETDLLEREVDAAAVSSVSGGAVELDLRPFQLVTLRLKR